MIPYSQIYLAFKAKVLGAAIDYDGAYGNQCPDPIKLLCEFLGVYSVRGNAYQWADPNHQPTYGIMAQNFTWVTSNFQQGDIIIFNKSSIMPYGHIALVDSVSGQSAILLEQDGSIDKDKDGNADGVMKLATWSLESGVAGAWRWKSDGSAKRMEEALEKINKYVPRFPIRGKTKPGDRLVTLAADPINPPVVIPPLPKPSPKPVVDHAASKKILKRSKIRDETQRAVKRSALGTALATPLMAALNWAEDNWDWMTTIEQWLPHDLILEGLILLVSNALVAIWTQIKYIESKDDKLGFIARMMVSYLASSKHKEVSDLVKALNNKDK